MADALTPNGGGRWPSLWSAMRDVILVALGTVIVLHELIVAETTDPALLALAAALLGLPLVVRADRRGG